MSSSTTTYDVRKLDADREDQGSLLEKPMAKKAKAVEFAQAHRKTTGEGVRVVTSGGSTVFEQLAKKTIKMTPRFQRVVTLPEGAIIPEGVRVAYPRIRKNLAITHDPNAPEGEQYAVVRYTDGEVLAEGLPTTRASGAFCKTVPVPAKAEPEPEPANA